MANKSSTNDPLDPVAGFVLAGGQSRRMGQDKASLPWGSDTLLEHMLRLVLTVASEVRVVGRNGFPDRVPNLGPLGGIATALESSQAPLSLVVAVDMPLLSAEFLTLFRQRLITTRSHLVACRIGSRYPLCLGLRSSALPVIHKCLKGSRAVHEFIETAQSDIITETELRMNGFDPGIFSNINTPEEWQKARQKIATKQGIT